MVKKECMMVRNSFYTFIEDLDFDEIGKLFTLMFLYSMPDSERTESQRRKMEELLGERMVRIAFGPFKKAIDDDDARYQKNIVERNRANGAKGGRPHKNPFGSIGAQKTPITTTSTTTTTTTTTPILGIGPKIEEVIAYAPSICVTRESAERFFWYYERVGWMLNDKPIANWKAALMVWKNNSFRFGNGTNISTGNDFHAVRREEIASIAIDAARKSAGKAL